MLKNFLNTEVAKEYSDPQKRSEHVDFPNHIGLQKKIHIHFFNISWDQRFTEGSVKNSPAKTAFKSLIVMNVKLNSNNGNYLISDQILLFSFVLLKDDKDEKLKNEYILIFSFIWIFQKVPSGVSYEILKNNSFFGVGIIIHIKNIQLN